MVIRLQSGQTSKMYLRRSNTKSVFSLQVEHSEVLEVQNGLPLRRPCEFPMLCFPIPKFYNEIVLSSPILQYALRPLCTCYSNYHATCSQNQDSLKFHSHLLNSQNTVSISQVSTLSHHPATCNDIRRLNCYTPSAIFTFDKTLITHSHQQLSVALQE